MTQSEKIKIILSTQDEASAEIKKLQKEFKKLGGESILKANKEADLLRKNIDRLTPEIKDAKKETKGWRGALDKLSPSMKSMVTNIASMAVAYKALSIGKEIIVESVVEAAKYEATIKSLDAVVASTGRNQLQVYAAIESQLGGLASKANITTGFLKGMTTELGVNEINNLTTSIKNASIAMGEDFNTQFPLIIKGLKQLNPAILDNIGVTVRLDELNRRITRGYYGAGNAINEFTQQNAIYQEIQKQTAKFRGQEEAFLETARGKWVKLTAAVADQSLELGALLLKGLNPVLGVLTAFTKGADEHGITIRKVNEKYDKMEEQISDLREQYRDGTIDLKTFQTQLALIGKMDTKPLFNEEQLKLLNEAALQYGVIADQAANLGNTIPFAQMLEFNKQAEEFKRNEAFETQKRHALLFAGTVRNVQGQINEAVTESDAIMLAGMHASMAEWQEEHGFKLETIKRGYTEEMTGAEELRAYKTELLELGMLEAEAFALAKNQLLYDIQLEHDEQMNELAWNRAAVELDITREQLETITNEYKKKLDKVQNYISQYTRRISSDFRSSIHTMVNDTDKGLLDIKEFWNSLGKSIRSIIIDMILDAILAMVAGIFKSMIAHAAEAIAVKKLTASYISLAAAKSAVNPMSAPGRIAAAATVKASLSGLLGFDDPVNDAVAERHGFDYANRFMVGQNKVFGAPNFGKEMVDMEPEQSFAQQGSSGGVTIVIEGSVIGTDEIGEIVEEAVARGRSRLATNSEYLSGSSEVENF